MAEKKQVDWNAVQRDRDAGMSGAEISKKYVIKAWEIYHHTKPRENPERTNERTNERTKPSIEGQREGREPRGRLQWSGSAAFGRARLAT